MAFRTNYRFERRERDRLKQQKQPAAVLLGAANGKVSLVAMIDPSLESRLNAVDWVKAAAVPVGGGGGGRPTMARAGGKNPEKLGDALATQTAKKYPDKFPGDPAAQEHFGMTTAEAMGYGAVPVAIGSGGQPEVVDDGVDGFLWRDVDQLKAKTRALVDDPHGAGGRPGDGLHAHAPEHNAERRTRNAEQAGRPSCCCSAFRVPTSAFSLYHSPP